MYRLNFCVDEVFVVDVNKVAKLLEEFNKIGIKPKRKETFMSISGYPHYENVVSNILKFFFEDNEHGMKNLWVRSLLETVPCFANVDFQNIAIEEVVREYTTNNQKRIDLVIVCDEYIVSVENKIRHCLANDLNEYAATITRLNAEYGGGKIEVNIVLSLNEVCLDAFGANIQNLCNITYDMFFGKIKENIGSYLLEADNSWLMKMQDFIYTIEGLKEGSFMDKNFAKFVYEKREDIENIFDAINNYRQNLKNAVRDLENVLRTDARYTDYEKNNSKNCKVKLFNYNSNETKRKLYSSTVVDIIEPNRTLTIETHPDIAGWHVKVWARKGNNTALKSVLSSVMKNNDIVVNDRAYEIALVPFIEGEYDEVVEKIVVDGFGVAEKVLGSSEW